MRKNKVQHKQSFIQGIKSSRALYLLLLPSFIIFLLFTYYPMYGVIIAFKDFLQPGDSWQSMGRI